MVERFFAERWIDAPPDPAKRGGAFSASTVPSVHPYVMLNYTGRRRDVLTLAHELGHGLHQTLAREQGSSTRTRRSRSPRRHRSSPSRSSSAGSWRDDGPGRPLALLAEAVEGQIATVFRQVAMNQFEDRSTRPDARRASSRSSASASSGPRPRRRCSATRSRSPTGYRSWWSYVPHFIGSPGYVYAYAFGQLLALSVYRLYTERGDEIVPAYLEMLTAGGSRSPEELGKIVGVDLTDPGFWDSGLDLVAEQVDQANEAADEILAAGCSALVAVARGSRVGAVARVVVVVPSWRRHRPSRAPSSCAGRLRGLTIFSFSGWSCSSPLCRARPGRSTRGHRAGLQHLVGERVLDVALDRAAQRPGAHGRVPALVDQQLLGVLREVELQLVLGDLSRGRARSSDRRSP